MIWMQGDMLEINPDAILRHDVVVYDAYGQFKDYTWRWEGGKVAEYEGFALARYAPNEEIRSGSVVNLDSVRVKVIGPGPHLSVYVMLDGWKATLWRPIYRVLAFLQEMGRRTLLTLCIWRVVHWEPAVSPQWSDFRPLRWWRMKRKST